MRVATFAREGLKRSVRSPERNHCRRQPHARRILALEDGRIFNGRAAGARTRRGGEVVFNTSLTGYQEVFTDPSYSGQIVCLTYPHIGNVGTNPTIRKSERPYIEVADRARIFAAGFQLALRAKPRRLISSATTFR